MSAPHDTPIGRERIWLATALGAALLVALPLWPGGFMTDDWFGLRLVNFGPTRAELDEPDPGRALPRLFVEEAVERYQLYRPLVPVTFAVDQALWGLDPRGYLITDVLLRLLGTFVLWRFLGALLPGLQAAARGLACVVFAAGPAQIEVLAWSSARSDSLSWILGGLALTLSLRRPERLALPVVLATAALLCKESAIVFLLLLPVVAAAGRGAGRPEADRWRSRLRAALVCGLVLAGYLALRGWVFGSVVPRYGGRDVAAGIDLAEMASRFASSTAAVLVPLSRAVFADEDGIVRSLVAAVFAIAWLVLLPVGAAALARRGWLPAALTGALFALPFALGVLANPIGAWLVNARAAHTPMAALAAIAAAAAAVRHPRLRGVAMTALAALALVSLAAGLPTSRAYARAKAGIAASIASLRDALAETRSGTAVVVGYPEDDWFGGGYTVSGSLHAALSRPFAPRDHRVLLVRSDEPLADAAHLTPFPEVATTTPAELAVLGPRPGVGPPHAYALLHPGPLPADGTSSTRLIAPVAGVAVDPAGPGIELVWTTRDRVAVRWELVLFRAAGPLGPYPLPGPDPARVDDAATMRLPIRIPPEELGVADGGRFAWAVHGRDPEGRLVAASPLGWFDLRLDGTPR